MSESRSRTFIVIIILVLALGGLVALFSAEDPAFPEWSGPIQQTVLPTTAPAETSVELYQSNGRDSLAILLKNEESSWLGLALGLKSLGVPFRIVDSVEEAMLHDVVLVYPLLTGANTQAQDLQRFAEHVRSGKTLIAFSVIGGGMPDLFGFESTVERSNLDVFEFQQTALTDAFIFNEAERSISLRSFTLSGPGLPGVSYSNLKHPPVAIYGDNSAAISYNFFEAEQGVGHAYAVGLDFGHYIMRAQNGRFTSYAETYVNDYQPKLDSLLRFIKQVFQQGESNAVTFYTSPYNKPFTALMTHDIDFTRSLNNVLGYAEYENEQGIPATYFVQTKYVTDYNDAAFFDESRIDTIKQLESLGMEIASHSVAHSNEFQSMPTGTGLESYPAYEPFVHDFETVRNASISGELRVSKFLLDSMAQAEVVSFRPGHLSFPQSLSQMLQATGYRYSSSITANSALTHLPYRMTFNRDYSSQTDIFEFPVTIEDEIYRLGSRINEAIAVAENIGRHGGLVNLLIHTDVLDHKLEFEKQFIERFKDEAWFTTVRDFGDWWSVRDTASLAVEDSGAGERKITINIEGSIDGLTLEVPASWRLEAGPVGSEQQATRVIIGEFSELAELTFQGEAR